MREQSIVLIIVIMAAGLLSSYLIYDVEFRDSDHDGLRDWVERRRYGTDPMSPDSDGDGLTDAYEIKVGLDPLKPNPLYVYLRDRGYVKLYELFRPLEADGLSEAEGDLVEAYLSLSDVERNDSHIMGFLKSVVEDGVVEEEEIERFRDRAFRYCLTKGLDTVEAEVFEGVECDDEFERLLKLYISLNYIERRCASTLDVIRGIVKDGVVNSDEVALFDDMFVNPTKPVVEIAWKPIRVVNDKIYDIEITVEARDDKTPIKGAELRFIPVEYYYMIEKYQMRPEDYPKVFPPDKERIYNLTPIDGAFDELNETFKINVTDIIGGREYRIVAIVEDEAGNVYVEEIKTPYIRQYENIAKLDNILICATYFTFWDVYWKYSPAGRWMEVGVSYNPLLGFYNSCDKIVIDKHIDWATGNGIDVFILEFGWIRPDSPYDIVVRKYLFESDLIDSIKFAIFYFPRDLYYDFSFMSTYYFNHSSYLKINEKPLIFIVDLPIYWREFGVNKTNNLFKNLKDFIKREYGYELFLFGDIWPDINSSFLDDLNTSFNGIFNWGNLWYNVGGNEVSYSRYADKYSEYWKKWSSLAEKNGLYFALLILPGFNDNPYATYYNKTYHCIERNPERFYDLLQVAKKYATSLGVIIFYTWNDFHEGTCIEPTLEYGFTYLNIIKRCFFSIGYAFQDR